MDQKTTKDEITELLALKPEGFNRLLLLDLEAREEWQKNVNHVFHYTKEWDRLENIIKTGFLPSYCKETLSEDESVYTAMVSFCNIAITETNKYLRYGKWGIGLSIDWAKKNQINPVFYVHEGTPFKSIFNEVSTFLSSNNFHNSQPAQKIFDLNRMMFKYMKNSVVDYIGMPINAYQKGNGGTFLPSINVTKLKTQIY